MADATRIVEILLKLGVDPANASVAQAVAKQVADAQAGAGEANKQTVTEQAKIANEQVSNLKRAQAEYDRYTAKGMAANRQVVEGSKQALEGIMGLARGMVLLGVASEKDLEKAVKTLAKFEAGANILKGVVNTVQGATKAYEGYRTAVAAAAAAQTALATAQAASTAAGAAGVAIPAGIGVAGAGAVGVSGAAAIAGIAAPIALAAAALAALAVSAKLVHEQFTGIAGQEGTLSQRIGDPLAGAASKASNVPVWISPLAAAFSALIGGGGLDTAEDRTGRLEKAQTTRDKSIIAEEENAREIARQLAAESAGRDAMLGASTDSARNHAGIGRRMDERPLAQAQAAMAEQMKALSAARANTASAMALPDAGINTGVIRNQALTDEESALRRVISLQQEVSREEENREKSALERANAQVEADRESLQTVKDRLEAAKQERQGIAERILSTDPLATQAAGQAAEKARRGQDISIAEAKNLQQFGLNEPEIVEAIRKAFLTAASGRAGADDLLRNTSGEVAQQQRYKDQISIDLDVDFEKAVKLELQFDAKQMGTEIGEQAAEVLQPFLDELKDTITKKIAAAVRDQDRDRRAGEARKRQSGS